MQTRREFAVSLGLYGACTGLAFAQNAAAPAPAKPRAKPARPFLLVMLGDSLTAGFGLAREAAPPARIEAVLRANGIDVKVVNAGSSGDLAASGLARLDWSVPAEADGVLIELGANDMLQGRPPARTKADLAAIIRKLKARPRPPLIALAGMRAHSGLGIDYRRAFDGLYPELAKAENLPLYPFFLDKVALNPTLNQADGIHPNETGAKILAEAIAPFIEMAFGLRRKRPG